MILENQQLAVLVILKKQLTVVKSLEILEEQQLAVLVVLDEIIGYVLILTVLYI